MFLSPSRYRKLLFIALAMLFTVPCSVKRDLKEWLQIETTQRVKPEHQRIACSSFYQFQKQDKKEKVEKHILPSPVSDVNTTYFASAKPIQLLDFYNRQKEKIPSYILFERFLI